MRQRHQYFYLDDKFLTEVYTVCECLPRCCDDPLAILRSDYLLCAVNPIPTYILHKKVNSNFCVHDKSVAVFHTNLKEKNKKMQAYVIHLRFAKIVFFE
jgi:hypothetical protein